MNIVSILVAVYNVENYLSKCLDSLLAQTYQNIQILCVDDCSTDHSLQILHDYAQRDHRIEVYKMEFNSGQAKVRNEALKHAKGKYVAFLDSDDWLAPDSIEQTMKVFCQHSQTDCVLMRVLTVDEKGIERDYDKPIPSCLTGRDAFNLSIDCWGIHGCYVARKELYEQWPYDDTCMAYSDDNTTHLHYYHSREVRYAQDARYYYRSYSQSVTHCVSVRRFDYLKANESMKRQLIDMNVDNDTIALYENQRWLVLVDCYMFYHVHGHELSNTDRTYGLAEMHRVWEHIDRRLLNKKTIAKFGYRPCSRWWLFRCQEWLYFTLRGILGKNN